MFCCFICKKRTGSRQLLFFCFFFLQEKERLRQLRKYNPEKPSSTEMNLSTYTHEIRRCAQAGHWKKAIDILRKIEKYGTAPNVIVYNAAIFVCRRAGQMGEAYKLYEVAVSFLSNSYPLKPHINDEALKE